MDILAASRTAFPANRIPRSVPGQRFPFYYSDRSNLWIDVDKRIALLRVAACFMVILLHVSAGQFMTWDDKWWAGNFYDALVRPCVPLFLMISGATLLSRQEPFPIFFRKRFVRVIPPLLFWSLFYLALSSYNGEKTGNWAISILSGPTKFHLWYFYELIGLYLIVPILRKFFQGGSLQDKHWLLGIWFVLAVIVPVTRNLLKLRFPWADIFDQSLSNFNFSLYQGFAGYLVLGAYAAESKCGAKTGLFMFISASLCTMAGTFFVSSYLGKPSELFFDYLSPFVVVAAYGLFVVFMAMKPGPPSKLVSVIGECTLGIYGLHIFIIDPVFEKNGFSAASGNPWLTIPLVSVCVFLLSFAVIYLLRLVRPLRYFI
jgi:surface polysaccharide O-acyltransferase-like enzyme